MLEYMELSRVKLTIRAKTDEEKERRLKLLKSEVEVETSLPALQ